MKPIVPHLAAVEDLLVYAQVHLSLNDENLVYCRNKLLDELRLPAPADDYVPDVETLGKLNSPQELLQELSSYAVKTKVIPAAEQKRLEYRLLDLVCPRPSEISAAFDERAAREGIRAACDFLQDYYVKSNTIICDDTSANLGWTAQGSLGRLEVMINMARGSIKNVPHPRYPDCPLCCENTGFTGAGDFTPRTTFRNIPIFLNDKIWYLQYSPLRYFPEHFNLVSSEHTPMENSPVQPMLMFDFLEVFPYYFIAYNAPLPRIGASNLSHSHYQGGECDMPVFSAPAKIRLVSPDFPDLRISLVDWYNSVIRLESRNRRSVEAAYARILDEYLEYACPKINLKASSGQTQHNAMALCGRLTTAGEYILDVFFRNNYADEAHPQGVFGTPPELEDIKSESIGIIESLGYFILPAELGSDAQGIKDFMMGTAKLKDLQDSNHPLSCRLGMIAQLINDNGTDITDSEAEQAIEKYINRACERMLLFTAIFNSETGIKELLKMLKKVNIVASEV